MRPLLFLDFDDVICLNSPYGGNDVVRPRAYGQAQPADLWDLLFAKSATDVLLTIMDEFNPAVVISSSWLAHFERPGMEVLLKNCGLGVVAGALHQAWDAQAVRDKTRLWAIEAWLKRNHQGEPFVILDDTDSGTGLRGSKLHKAGRVVLCEVGVGLTTNHLTVIRQALITSPRQGK